MLVQRSITPSTQLLVAQETEFQQRNTKTQLLGNHRIFIGLLLFLVGWTFVSFATSLFEGTPVGDDDLLLAHAANTRFEETLTTTWEGLLDPYGMEKTSHSDMYRPLVDASLHIDIVLNGFFPWYTPFITNFVFSLILSLLVVALLRILVYDIRVVVFCSLLYIVHPLHTDAAFALANRTDVLSGVFALSALIIATRIFLNADQSLPRLWYFYVASLVGALLAKETGVILVTAPLLAGCFVQFFKGVSINYRKVSLLSIISGSIVLLYLLFRFILFDGRLGSYNGGGIDVVQTGKHVVLSIAYLIFGVEKDVSSVLQYGWLILPLILFVVLSLRKRREGILPVFILFCFSILWFFPAAFYVTGKRFGALPLAICIVAVALSLLYINSWRQRKVLWSGVLSIAVQRMAFLLSFVCATVMYCLFWWIITIEFDHAYEIRKSITTQLSMLRVDSDTVFVALPYEVSDNAFLFINGVDSYFTQFEQLKNKCIVPLALTSTKDRLIPSRVEVEMLAPSIIRLRGGVGNRLRLPQVYSGVDSFECKYFKILEIKDKTDYRFGEAIYQVKVEDFTVLSVDVDSLVQIRSVQNISRKEQPTHYY